jgi:hypothetical protein
LPSGGFVSNVQVGKPRSLRVGADSFDLLITFRFIGLRTDLHIAAFRIDRVIGVLITGGKLGARVPLPTMSRLAGIMAAQNDDQLAPRNSSRHHGVCGQRSDVDRDNRELDRRTTCFSYQGNAATRQV